MAKVPEIYVSTDIEADGPIPGPHSMLSFGSAAYAEDKRLIATFTANLETLPGASPDPEIAAWWATKPAAWEACRRDLQRPEEAMKRYVTWLKGLPGKPIFVGFPATFDFMFIYWYLIRFAGESPFGFAAVDAKTFGMAMLKCDYKSSTKRKLKHWLDDIPHTHIALDDAIGQGALFCNMLKDNRRAA